MLFVVVVDDDVGDDDNDDDEKEDDEETETLLLRVPPCTRPHRLTTIVVPSSVGQGKHCLFMAAITLIDCRYASSENAWQERNKDSDTNANVSKARQTIGISSSSSSNTDSPLVCDSAAISIRWAWLLKTAEMKDPITRNCT